MTTQAGTINEVEQFWNSHPCNSGLSDASERRIYFFEIEKRRYANEPHIPQVARFADFQEKDVLEIGCGVGTDGRRFSAWGANYTGINLDVGSTMLASEAFRLSGLPGNIRQMNGQAMQFPDRSFDHIYCFGVIHHSPRPEAIAAEMLRVLKPNGTFTVMLYNRDSVNYRLEIMLLRKLFRLALYPKSGPALLSKLGLNRSKLEGHRKLLLGGGMTHDRWVSINTDGPDCPLARVYSAREALDLFNRAGFVDTTTYVRFFDSRHYGRLGSKIPPRLVRFLGNNYGWHRIVEGRKP